MAHSLGDFLARALDWPTPEEGPGWVNLHWRRKNGKGITGGRAFKTLSDMVSFIRWATTHPKGRETIADLYYCTSLQKDHDGENGPNKHRAKRGIDNTLSSKVLFADVDKYPDKHKAILAIMEFCEASNSPAPSALVDSGGGIHSYWFLPEALPPEQWLPLAHKFDGLMNEYGLKHDNISTDMARILRPPETVNFKRDTPMPVVLKMLNGDVDLNDWKSLLEARPTPAALPKGRLPVQNTPLHELFVNPALAEGGPAPAFAQLPVEDRIGQGVLDPAPVLQLCPMFRETLETGGWDVRQPVWHQQALACTFFSGGRDVFHNLSRLHPGYILDETDEMFDRKANDRVRKGLGYPACATFERDGAEQCKTCPLKGQVTSPLNITEADLPREPAIKVAALLALPDEGAADLVLFELSRDDGFCVDDEGFPCKIRPKAGPERIMRSRILGARPFDTPKGKGLRVRMTGQKDEIVNISIPPAAFKSPSEIQGVLNDGGALTMNQRELTADLMCSIRGRMSVEQGANKSMPFGWVFPPAAEGEKVQGDPIGFSYGGQVFYPEGAKDTVPDGDDVIYDTYFVNGSPEPWFQALTVILNTKQPGLMVGALCSFAAPLVFHTGRAGTTMMLVGETGALKSSAVAVGVAAFANPKDAMLKPSTSNLALLKRMSKVRHLVTVWDDVSKDSFPVMKKTLMEVTQGGEGLKLDKDRRERSMGSWESMVVTTSNDSIAEYLGEENKNHGAHLVRCFEYRVSKIQREHPGYLDPNKQSRLFAELNSNHGHMGRHYAKLLGSNPMAIKALVAEAGDRIAELVAPFENEERYWMAAAATILAAGRLMNQLLESLGRDLRFDLPVIEDFLKGVFFEMRNRRLRAINHAGDIESSSFTSTHLSNFFIDHAGPNLQMVWTKDMPRGPGRKWHKTAPISPLDMSRTKRVSVRWLTEERIVRIAKRELELYLREQKISTDLVTAGLTRYYGASLSKATMAVGLPSAPAGAGPEMVYDIRITEGSWLDEMLSQHTAGEPE